MFFPMEAEVSRPVLRRLHERTTTLAFFADDQWRFERYSSQYAELYSFVATTDPLAVPGYRALGGRPILSQWAGRLVGEAAPPPPEEAFRHDVSFVGSWNHYRGWFVGWLGRHGVPVECFGAGWPNGRLGYAEVEAVFRTSRVNLNLSNSRQLDLRYVLSGPRVFANNFLTPKDVEQVKARHFEIPMAAGFQLSSYAVGLEDWLRIGEEVMVFASPEDCLRQVRLLLPDAERRRRMTEQAWRRCLAEHTYERRVASLLASVWPGDGAAPG
jgi:spore maturation protein CgeB